MNSRIKARAKRPPARTFQGQKDQTSMEIDVRLCQLDDFNRLLKNKLPEL